MLISITNTTAPATDLGYLLHKNPERVHELETSFGQARVFYTEATEEKCTAALLVDIDPVGLVRGRRNTMEMLDQYVNDRPYVASSFLSVALKLAFSTAMAGNCNRYPELVNKDLNLAADIPVLPCRGGEHFLRSLFEPLGYSMEVERLPLDTTFPEWGDSSYFHVRLSLVGRLKDLLDHLYVLVPVLDNEKHYWVGDDELEKLLKKGETWLAGHPAKEEIVRRYLKFQRHLARQALERLIVEEGDPEAAEDNGGEPLAVKMPRLNEIRLDTVAATLKASGAKRVLDLGCGEGRLLKLLLQAKEFSEIVGMDVSHRVLEHAMARLRYEELPQRQKDRLKLIHGSLLYRDRRLAGYDAAAVVEVIEHLDPPRLVAFERVVFEFARPKTVVLTTPNAEYNAKFQNMEPGTLRHDDHRFEWTRGQFRSWCDGICARFGYQVSCQPVGMSDEQVGAPTQMAVFTAASGEDA